MDVDQVVPIPNPRRIILVFHRTTRSGSSYYPNPSLWEVDPAQIQLNQQPKCCLLPLGDNTLFCVLESSFHERLSGSEFIRRLVKVREASTANCSWIVSSPYAGEDEACMIANESFFKELLENTIAAQWTLYFESDSSVSDIGLVQRLKILFPKKSILTNLTEPPQYQSRTINLRGKKQSRDSSHYHQMPLNLKKSEPSKVEADFAGSADNEEKKEEEEGLKDAQGEAMIVESEIHHPVEPDVVMVEPEIILSVEQDAPLNAETPIGPMEQAPAEPSPAPEHPKADPIVLSEEDLRCLICYTLDQSSLLTECCGHIICPECSRKITRCPVCRKFARFVPAPFVKRYIAIAQSRSTKETCSCGFIGTETDFQTHPFVCPNRQFYCPLCNVSSLLPQFKTHLKAYHRNEVLLWYLRFPKRK